MLPNPYLAIWLLRDLEQCFLLQGMANGTNCITHCEKQANRLLAGPGDWPGGFFLILAHWLGNCELKPSRSNSLPNHLKAFMTCPSQLFHYYLSLPLCVLLTLVYWFSDCVPKNCSKFWWKGDSRRESFKNTALGQWSLPPLTLSRFVCHGSHSALYLTFHRVRTPGWLS